MQFNESTPRKDLKIGDTNYSVPAPFFAGHQLTENEADVMNQTLAENIRNNVAARIKKLPEGTAFSQADVDAYISTYEFGVRERIGDPVEAKAMELARNAVVKAIEKRGEKAKDYTAKAVTEKAKATLAANPQLRKAAEKMLKAEAAAIAEVPSD